MGQFHNAPILCPHKNFLKTPENVPQAKLGTGDLDVTISSTQIRLTNTIH